jgi:hypothetical protein
VKKIEKIEWKNTEKLIFIYRRRPLRHRLQNRWNIARLKICMKNPEKIGGLGIPQNHTSRSRTPHAHVIISRLPPTNMLARWLVLAIVMLSRFGALRQSTSQ